MPVEVMLALISSKELSEWQAFFVLENEEFEQRKLANQSLADVQRRNR